MRSRTILYAAAFILSTAAFTTHVVSQSGKDKPKQEPPAKGHDHDQDHAHHEHDSAAALPGPEHKLLAKYVGEWTTKSTFTVPGQPAGEPVTGSSKIASDLGGRFFSDQSSGEMMGEPYESRHYTGYNNATKQYESVWTWTHDTGMLHMTGTSKDGGKTINWTGSYVNPAGEKEVLNAVTTHVDDNKLTIELRGEGAEAGVMKTEYTRKK
jgi:hypothetical protein